MSYLEVVGLDSLASLVLSVEMRQLLLQGCGVVQEVDGDIQAVDDTNAMGLELGTFHVINIYALEQALGLREVSEQTVGAKKMILMTRYT